jgi:hypothetical protein
MTNLILPNTESMHLNVNRGESYSLSFDLFENTDLKPLDLSSWTFFCTVYNKADHQFYELSYTVDGNSVVFDLPSEITQDLGLPDNLPINSLDFDIQGFSPEVDLVSDDNTLGMWNMIMGTIKSFGIKSTES